MVRSRNSKGELIMDSLINKFRSLFISSLYHQIEDNINKNLELSTLTWYSVLEYQPKIKKIYFDRPRFRRVVPKFLNKMKRCETIRFGCADDFRLGYWKEYTRTARGL